MIKEGIRVVRNMPNWKCGKQRGTPVRVRYTLPIQFKLGNKRARKQTKSD